MLQKRKYAKYHSGSLWTNTCCSHPLPGENIKKSAQAKLVDEMGITVEPHFLFKFLYRADLDNNMIEHEIDYVFVGTYDGIPTLNIEEADDWLFLSLDEVRKQVLYDPAKFTVWFKLILELWQGEFISV